MFEKWAEKFKDKSKETEDIRFADYDAMKQAQQEKTAQTTPAAETGASINAASEEQNSNIELKVVHPEAYEEVGTIADYLIEGCTVVLNVDLLDRASTLRMLDFLNGVTYTTDGDIKKVAQNTYIITPVNVDVTDEK